jgi:hypothetical protein
MSYLDSEISAVNSVVQRRVTLTAETILKGCRDLLWQSAPTFTEGLVWPQVSE